MATTSTSRIEELKARRDAARAAAEAKALSDAEREEKQLLDEEAAHLETAAAADASRREMDGARRADAARAKFPRALLQAIDLVALFPIGNAPAEEQIPGAGVVVIRNPSPDALDRANAEIEQKKKTFSAIAIELVCASVVDPDPNGSEGIVVRGFFDAYPDAAVKVAGRARALGGAKADEDKRGRA